MTVQANDHQVSDQIVDPSGVENSKDETAQSVEDKAHDVVSYHQHKKLLAQRKADQLKAKEMAEKLADYERQDAERHESLLAEQNKYKELVELKEQKLKEMESREKERERALLDGAKLNAFKELLPGQVNNKSYYAFVNLDAIECDPETGVVDQDSVEKQVNEFVTHHRGLYTPKNGAKLPYEAAGAPAPTNYVDELKLCRSQKELDACKKKWGRQ